MQVMTGNRHFHFYSVMMIHLSPPAVKPIFFHKNCSKMQVPLVIFKSYKFKCCTCRIQPAASLPSLMNLYLHQCGDTFSVIPDFVGRVYYFPP